MKTAALCFAVWATLGYVPGAFAWDILPTFRAPKIPQSVVDAEEKKQDEKSLADDKARIRAHVNADISEIRAANRAKSGNVTIQEVAPPVYPERTPHHQKNKHKK